MSAESKPHSKPSTDNPDVLTVYYGIHDALRELGDDLHDAGDGPGLDTPHVISGLWDASSALSRLFEQLETLREAVREHVESAHGQYATDKHAKLRAALSNPASSPESPCSICGTYGHFTHNHERETSSPAKEPK